jgi:hypothetical protein
MARSVLPLMSQFDRIELSAQTQEGDEILDPVLVTEGSADLTLGPGAWDVTANAYIASDSVTPAAAAFTVITNLGGNIGGDPYLSLLPVGTGPGTLHYAVTLEGVSLNAEGSRIQVELQGEVQDSQTIDESSSSGEFSLAPGIYAADIVLTNAAGKTAAYREAVSILSGLITEIAFAPEAGEFLDPGARALLTAPVLFQPTAGNSSEAVFTNGGSDVRRTLNIKAPPGKNTIYFAVKKNSSQTLMVSGTEAARVSTVETAVDGTTPSSALAVFAVDVSDLAQTGGTVSFVITAGETGKTPIETAVTIPRPQLLSIAGEFIRVPDHSLSANVYRLAYQVGEDFDYENFRVVGLYSDGNTLRETEYTIEGFDTTTPGTKTIRLSKYGIYGTIGAESIAGQESMDIYVVEKSNTRLVFDYGNWGTSAVPALVPPGGYTTPIGRPLVLAPVKWNVPDNAVYEWKVDGVTQTPTHPVDTEYFTFNPTAQKKYSVTVTATLEGGQTLSATTDVTCCPPEGTFINTAKSPDTGGYWAVGRAPSLFSLPGDSRYHIGGGGFGGGAGTKIFTESLRNSGNYDLRITGNAFGGWIEPGVIWVAQDANGNGIMDDTWYELGGSVGADGKITRRYAVTFYSNGTWQDNRGETGYVPGGAAWYPHVDHDWITLTNTLLENTRAENTFGYVDTWYSLFKISDAVQADGSPVHLEYIDYVVVKTGEHLYTMTGEKSTEIYGGINAYNPYDPERSLTGVSDNNGGYTYKLVNNSGYGLTVPVAVLNGVFTDHNLAVGANETFTLSENKVYFDYSGGNVIYTVVGNTVTFQDRP